MKMHIVVMIVVLALLMPAVMAESGPGESGSGGVSYHNYKVTGKLLQGESETYFLGKQKYRLTFASTMHEDPFGQSGSISPYIYAGFSVQGPSGTETIAVAQGQSKTLKDGLVIFVNALKLTYEGSGSSGRYRAEFTLICDDKCQGISPPPKVDDWGTDCKTQCIKSCGSPTVVQWDSPEAKCVGECIKTKCNFPQPVTEVYPQPNPKEQCMMNYKKCTEIAEREGEGTLKICEEKFNSCLNDIPYGPSKVGPMPIELLTPLDECSQQHHLCLAGGRGNQEKCLEELKICKQKYLHQQCEVMRKQCWRGLEQAIIIKECKRGKDVRETFPVAPGEAPSRVGGPAEVKEIALPAQVIGGGAEERSLPTQILPQIYPIPPMVPPRFEICEEELEGLKKQCQETYEMCLQGRVMYRPGEGQAFALGRQECPQGCFVDSEVKRCVPIGTRLTSVKGDPQYCSVDGSVYAQKEDGEAAENDYECRSNSARYGVCENVAEQVNILQKIFGWLGKLLGGA